MNTIRDCIVRFIGRFYVDLFLSPLSISLKHTWRFNLTLKR